MVRGVRFYWPKHSLLFEAVPLKARVIGGHGQFNASTKTEIDSLINHHAVALFSKTYCRYSKGLKQILSKYRIRDIVVTELNTRPDGRDILACNGLCTSTGEYDALGLPGDKKRHSYRPAVVYRGQIHRWARRLQKAGRTRNVA